MRSAFLFVLLAILCLPCKGQYNTNQNKVWAFGQRAGLDFATGSPVPITTAITAIEGTASVSDTSGALLFYTNGKTVWNRSNLVMSGGLSITPDTVASTSQATLIVPVLAGTQQFYVFSLEDSHAFLTDTGFGRLRYSVVDMSLDGGMGAVVSSGKLLKNKLSEKMTAVAGDNCDVWLVTHENVLGSGMPTFCAFHISAAGIDTVPVRSVAGRFTTRFSYMQGMIQASPDGRKLVATCWGTGIHGVELYDFDAATGIVSNTIVLDSIYNVYGAAFSPDNSKLYISGNNVQQFDVTSPDAADVLASRDTVSASGWVGGIQIGPDDKIYLLNSDMVSLSRIEYPNAAGTACTYNPAAVTAAATTSYSTGFPNVFIDRRRPLLPNTPVITLSGTSGTYPGNTVTISADLSTATGSCIIIWMNKGVPFDTTAGTTVTYTKGVGTDTITAMVMSTSGTCYYPITSAVHTVADNRTGIADTRLQALKVYPYPVTDQLVIQNAANTQAVICNMAGTTMYSFSITVDRYVVPMASLPPGVYVLVVAAAGGERIVERIVKY